MASQIGEPTMPSMAPIAPADPPEGRDGDARLRHPLADVRCLRLSLLPIPVPAAMKLYAGTTEQFRADARMHRIAEKLRAEYTTQIGHRPAPSEVASWQNSLTALSMLLDQAELCDHGVILEYQLGTTSRRLDAMLTGHAAPET
jgi:hypothetical protein